MNVSSCVHGDPSENLSCRCQLYGGTIQSQTAKSVALITCCGEFIGDGQEGCDLSWREYAPLLDSMRYILFVFCLLQAIIAAWRLMVLTRMHIRRRIERRARDLLITSPRLTSISPAAGLGCASIWQFLRYQTDSQWWFFVFTSLGNVLNGLEILDPVMSERIWNEDAITIIRMFQTGLLLDGVACWARFFLVIHAKWHTPTRRLINWFDRFMIIINLTLIIGFLSYFIGSLFHAQPSRFVLQMVYVGVLLFACSFLWIGGVWWGQTSLSSIIKRLDPKLTMTTNTRATSSMTTSPTPPVNHAVGTANGISGLVSSYPPPTAMIASKVSSTSHNMRAYHAARQMLIVLRWFQLGTIVEVLVIMYHSLTNAGLNDAVAAIVYFYIQRGVGGIATLAMMWSLGRQTTATQRTSTPFTLLLRMLFHINRSYLLLVDQDHEECLCYPFFVRNPDVDQIHCLANFKIHL
jgi:hypothetical protein